MPFRLRKSFFEKFKRARLRDKFYVIPAARAKV